MRTLFVASTLVMMACAGKVEPTARERVAAVLEKDQPRAPKSAGSEVAKKIAPDPAAPTKAEPVAKNEPATTEPVVKVEPRPTEAPVVKVEPEPVKAEPAKTEPAKLEPAKTEPAKLEPAKIEPIEAPDKVAPAIPSGQAMFELIINDAAMTTAIEDRFPAVRRTSFKVGSDAKVYAWFDIKNSGVPADVELVWKKAGKETWRIAVNVGAGKNWRTWAEKKIGKKDAGRWTVDVVDQAGHVYESLSYDVTGG